MTYTYIIAIIVLIVACLVLAAYIFILKDQHSKSDKKYTEKDLDSKIDLLKKELKVEQSELLQKEKDKIKEETEDRNQIVLNKLKLELQTQLQQDERQMRKRILDLQENVDKKETQVDLKLEKLEEEKNKVDKLKEELRNIKDDLLAKRSALEAKEQSVQQEINQKLEEVARLTHQEAKERITVQSKEEMGNELIDWQHKIVENAQEQANLKAREIVAMAVQRCSSEVANELTITTVKLSNEEDKGKIIGKQGRNIQWLEKTLGVELIIDETPEVVTISGFSSIRRNIAKLTLEKLLADGRIHPSSIEEMYEKAKAEIAQEIALAGEETVNELGIYDFPAKLIRLIGRLKYRTSYGQNMLKHSMEMARLAGLLADEMNEKFSHRTTPIDKMTCIKGALLHDIGKAIDEEMTPKGDHVQLGEKICDMFGLDWRIKKCVSSHHNEAYHDPEHGFCIEAVLVDACDNISGARPGARKETMEAYVQRMEGMEKIAKSTTGVTKAWIMRGSREMWVFFDTQNLTPAKMHDTTRKIAKDIGGTVKAPFKIKVIGFFEDRAVEYAA